MLLFKELECDTKESGRTYLTPSGKKYPSITTVLSKTQDMTALNEWKARVGAEEAKRIVTVATGNGTALHTMLEDHINALRVDPSDNPMVNAMYKQGVKAAKNITHVVQTEAPLYSNELMVAGRTDAIVFWKGKLSVLDWKNRGEKDHKRKEWCHDYQLQICFYSQCVKELTGKSPKYGVIVSLNTLSNETIEFDPFDDSLVEALSIRISRYRAKYS